MSIVESIKSNRVKMPIKKFFIHKDNSKVRNGAKSTNFLKDTKIKRKNQVKKSSLMKSRKSLMI